MAQSLKEHAEAERARLTARRDELQKQLDDINEELSAVQRYFGETSYQRTGKLTPRPQANRAERGSVQEQVKAAVLSTPQGITTSELNQRLEGMSPQSIQNALGALKKAGTISKDRRRGGPWIPTQAP